MLPILFQSHDLILYSYPLLMGLGWGIGYQIFFSLMPVDYPRIKAQIFFWGLFLFAWIGAKLLFYFTYPAGENRSFISEASFWMGGGFVFYGGFLGGGLFLLLFKLFDRKLTLNHLWPLLPALSIGHAIGRVGCLLAGCCFGKPTDWIWGIYLHNHYRHPTQAIEAVGLMLIGTYLLKSKAPRIRLFANYLWAYGLLRFGVESLRGDDIRGHWGFFSPSQWISLCLISAGLVLFFRKNKELA